jgi:Helix-turn-helix domain
MSQPALSPNVSPRYRPRASAAEYLKVAESTIAGWCDRGLITAYRHGGRIYIDMLETKTALERHGRSVMRDGRGRAKPLPYAAIVSDPQCPTAQRAKRDATDSSVEASS